MADDQLDTQPADGGPSDPASVTRSVDLDASPAAVWDALADPERRGAWLDDEDAATRALRVDATDPGRSLTWTWWRPDDEAGASQVHVELTELTDGSTRVAVTERLLAAPPASSHLRIQARAGVPAGSPATSSAVWGYRLLGLELLVVAAGALVR